MICCLDLIYANVLAEKRIDLINPNFKGLPPNWNTPDFDETQARKHCILDFFCDMKADAKEIKAKGFIEIIHSFFQTNVTWLLISDIPKCG